MAESVDSERRALLRPALKTADLRLFSQTHSFPVLTWPVRTVVFWRLCEECSNLCYLAAGRHCLSILGHCSILKLMFEVARGYSNPAGEEC